MRTTALQPDARRNCARAHSTRMQNKLTELTSAVLTGSVSGGSRVKNVTCKHWWQKMPVHVQRWQKLRWHLPRTPRWECTAKDGQSAMSRAYMAQGRGWVVICAQSVAEQKTSISTPRGCRSGVNGLVSWCRHSSQLRGGRRQELSSKLVCRPSPVRPQHFCACHPMHIACTAHPAPRCRGWATTT